MPDRVAAFWLHASRRESARTGHSVSELEVRFRPADSRILVCNMAMMSDIKAYGVVSLTEQREMTGLEFVRGLVTGSLPLNTMARTLGYDIVEAEEGRVVMVAISNEAHLNPNGTVHGGVAATLLDSCM